MELKFKVDTKHRKQWFTGISFSHPAKMSLPLQLWIIDNYTKEGEVILDPMAGIGTILVACTMGRNVICNELEGKFCKIMIGNWEKIQQRGLQLGYRMGWARIIQGDARNLQGLMADAIISSPPYEEAMGKKHHSPRADKLAREKSNPVTYTGIDESIGRIRKHGRTNKKQGGEFGRSLAHPYSPEAGNIGNLKSDSYLQAMLQVYQQCHRVLRPGGLMILVTKNFIRDRKVIRLDLDTIKLCEQAGFNLLERHYRKLPAQSFWRVIYYQKNPDVEKIDIEDILIFKRLSFKDEHMELG